MAPPPSTSRRYVFGFVGLCIFVIVTFNMLFHGHKIHEHHYDRWDSHHHEHGHGSLRKRLFGHNHHDHAIDCGDDGDDAADSSAMCTLPADKFYYNAPNWTMIYTEYQPRPLTRACRRRHCRSLRRQRRLRRRRDTKMVTYPNGTSEFTPSACTYDTLNCVARGSKLQAPVKAPDGSKAITNLPPCCRDKLIKTLIDTTKCLEKQNVMYTMWFGTVLGHARHGGHFMPHDHDGDLAISADGYCTLQRDDTFANCLEAQGHHVTMKKGCTPMQKVQVLTSATHRLVVDIFAWHEVEDQDSGLAYLHTQTNHHPALKTDVVPPQRVKWEGHWVYAPAKPEKYLDREYGDWKTVCEKCGEYFCVFCLFRASISFFDFARR